MKKVCLVQRIIPHYRVKFFDLLWESCSAKGIDLVIIYGEEKAGTVPKSVDYNRPWSKKVNNKYIQFKGYEFVWQPCVLDILKSDLIICEQANRLSVTYLIPFLRLIGKQVALWGHGKNLQAEHTGFNLKEFFKRKMVFLSDYFFAYTESSRKYLVNLGYEQNKITNVQNSIDVQALINELDRQKSADKINKENSIVAKTAIYCGGLYNDKKIDFLLKSCVEIKKSVEEFKLYVIGSGPDQYLIEDFSKNNPWVQFLGAKSSLDSVSYFLESKVFLMPGLVGLAVLDSFALETPMITTDIPIHSPEFEYLIHGVNGYVTGHSVHEYSAAVVSLLNDNMLIGELVKGCRESPKIYSIENMASNFFEGIQKALRSNNKMERHL